MRAILAIGWLFCSFPIGADGEPDAIPVGDGVELKVQKSPYHRGVPHAYYDQAMESIEQLYPERKVLVARRFGTLGEAVYSLVCYKENREASAVMVGGMLAAGRRSWIFDSVVPAEKFTDSLVLILEAISKLPSNERR